MRDIGLRHESTGQGDPIVLLPGSLSGWLSWLPFVAPLARDRHVVRVQLRSVELAEAGTAYPPSYGTLTECAALRATVDQLGLDRFDLVGWSYGGHIALAFALDYPRRVRTLTVIEPDASWLLRATGYDPDQLGQIEARERALMGQEVTVNDLKAFLVTAGLATPGQDVATLPAWPVWVRNRQGLSIIGTAWDYTASLARLRALEMPVLAVRGAEPTNHLVEVAERLAAIVPHGRLLTLPGDHACHIQNPDRFLAALAEHTAMRDTSSELEGTDAVRRGQ